MYHSFEKLTKNAILYPTLLKKVITSTRTCPASYPTFFLTDIFLYTYQLIIGKFENNDFLSVNISLIFYILNKSERINKFLYRKKMNLYIL